MTEKQIRIALHRAAPHELVEIICGLMGMLADRGDGGSGVREPVPVLPPSG